MQPPPPPGAAAVDRSCARVRVREPRVQEVGHMCPSGFAGGGWWKANRHPGGRHPLPSTGTSQVTPVQLTRGGPYKVLSPQFAV